MAKKKKRKLVTQTAFAKMIGVSRQAVQQAVASGRISKVNGKIDPVKAKKEWAANTDQSKPRNRVTGKPKGRRDPKKPETPMELDKEKSSAPSRKKSSKKRSTKKKQDDDQEKQSGGSTYAEARAAREVFNAKLAEIKLAKERGLLVESKRVEAAAFSLARRTRDQLIAIPERVCALLATKSDPNEVRHILEDEIEQVCSELSNVDDAIRL